MALQAGTGSHISAYTNSYPSSADLLQAVFLTVNSYPAIIHT